MPAVGFSQTSRDIRLEKDGRVLAATCRRSNGEWVPSTLDLFFYLANVDGILTFAQQRPGRFSLTSDNVTLTGATLRGSAKRRDQTSARFELDLDHTVVNIEGRLVWLANPAEPYNAPDNDETGFGSYNVSNDPGMANYAKSLQSERPKRQIVITEPTPKDRKDIQELVSLWNLDIMDRNLGQTTMVQFPRTPRSDAYAPYRRDWRIDNQENGSFLRNNLQYYNLAVQYGRDVYASVLVPV